MSTPRTRAHSLRGGLVGVCSALVSSLAHAALHLVFCARFLVMNGPAGKASTAASALADVDIAGWTLRFDLLSDPNRLEILLTLHRNPGLCVGDLAVAVGRSENAVSQALRLLRQQGWVKSTRAGRQVSYQLEDHTVHDLLHWIGAAHS